jgi:hypothetical protein
VIPEALGQHLRAGYDEHPRFRFADAPLQVDARLLQAFNNHYFFVRDCGSRLDAGEKAACLQTLQEQLDAVFLQLQTGATDAFEQLFVQELQAECKRLLTEEVALFAHKSLAGSIALRRASVRDNAAALAGSRHFFGRISPDAVAQMLAIGAADLAAFRSAAAQGKLRRDDLSVHQGPTVKNIIRVLNREFRSQGVLDAVSAYMGQRIGATGVALELSVPQATWWASRYDNLARAPQTLYAHLDESIVYPKSIVYLSDVDRSNGPTSIYPGAFESLALEPLQALVGRVISNVGTRPESPLRAHYSREYHQAMSSEAFRRHFMKLPAALRFNSHFGWDVLPDGAAERMLAGAEHFMTGGAGTYIVFDGARLLHRGGMLERGERIALQVIFSDISLKRRVRAKLRRMLSKVGRS